MTTQKLFFQSMANRERALVLNRSLATLLHQAVLEMTNFATLTPLQKNYLLAETAYVYQHFGFSLFGPTSRIFVAEQMSACSGIDESVLQTWFELLAFTLLEDFNMLKIVTGEPDWASVDAAFFRDFSRRILCFEAGDKADLGLDAWSDGFVEELCAHAVEWLGLLQSSGTSAVLKQMREYFDKSEFSQMMFDAMAENLEIVNENSLQILVWRIQFLTSFSDIRQEAKFFMRADGDEPEAKATRLAALLALLVTHESENGETLLPPSPLSSQQISNVLKSSFQSPHFDTQLFRNWMKVTDDTVLRNVAALAKEGVEAGLLFEVPNGKRSKGYGPTLTALKVLAPFQKTVTGAIMKEHAPAISAEQAGCAL